MGALTFLVHMHKKHEFFLPDVEYLRDPKPKGFLAYLDLKVKRYYMCLYYNDGCHPFGSLEAVQKYMEAKYHCKVHYGDGGDDEEAELEEFYDYSSRYLIRLLGDPPLRHSYREQNFLAERLASTMVTAGVFMIARCSPLVEYPPTALIVITFAGAMTLFLAATTGILQNDLKRVIAYSTCSQLGYMIFACGISSSYSVSRPSGKDACKTISFHKCAGNWRSNHK